MRVSGAIKSVLYGVTTNNLENANPNHMLDQVNVLPRIDTGLTKRPATEQVEYMGAVLAADDTEFVKDFVIHDVAYFLVYRTGGAMTVFREDGTEYTVTDAALDGYLDSVTEDDVAITVHGEQVYIVNKTKTVEMETSAEIIISNSQLVVKKAVPNGAIITVKYSDIGGVRRSVTHVVPATGTAGTAVDVIAAAIAAAINTAASPGVSAASGGGTVQILRTDSTYAGVTTSCSFGDDEYFTHMNGQVDNFTDLPRITYHRATAKVLTPGSEEVDPVFMKALAEDTVDELASAPGAPDPWPAAAFFTNGNFHWMTPGGTPNPSGNSYTSTYSDLAWYPPAGTVFWNGYEIQRIELAHWISSISQIQVRPQLIAASFAYTLLDGYLRFAEASAPNDTVHDSEMVGFSTWYIDGSISDITYDAGLSPYPYGLLNGWKDVYETTTLMLPRIHCRWVETNEPGVKTNLSASTMPHVLTPLNDTEFTWNAATWDARRAGDNTSNPIPRFVNKTIEDITVFQNRLCFLVDDEFIASASGNVLNFFRDTVTQLLSKHPVNLRSTSKDSSKFNYFVEHNRDLMITAGRQQYKITGEIPLTPGTGSLQLTTSYNAAEHVAPISLGNSVYIPSVQGNYLNVARYNGSVGSLNPDTADSITAHARQYIDQNVNSLAGLPNHGLIFANYSLGGDLYVCNYDTDMTREEDKRYAWFKWNDWCSDSTATIRAIATTKNKLMLVINSTTGLFLLKAELDTVESPHYMDFIQTATSVTTTINVGTEYPLLEADLKLVQGTGCPRPGDEVGVTSYVGGVITLDENMTSGTVYVGKEWTCQARPNLLTIKDEGGYVNHSARLNIGRFTISVQQTGPLSATPESQHDTYSAQEFTGLVSGDLDSITDEEARVTEQFVVGFKQKANEGSLLITSKSWLPMTITQIDWVGNYSSRGRRL